MLRDRAPLSGPTSQSLDVVVPGQGSPSGEAQESTQNHPALNGEDGEEGRMVIVERRRHVTGDSGIVLCELDDKAACQSEKNGDREGHVCTEAIVDVQRERGDGEGASM